jgi:glutamate N-acetyltransferase / amino-acid N-acetyltransferase
MKMDWIEGGVTVPPGFRAGAVYGGIASKPDKPDIAILCADTLCAAAAVCTTNKVKAAPVKLTEAKLASGHARALVVNSGCANAFTGKAGFDDASEMAAQTALKLDIDAGEVLVASTGVIGEFLPMVRVREAINRIVLKEDGGGELARAIMTTDTVPKEAAVKAAGFTVGGVAKGAGMIHPNMATMLAFITTDAVVAPDYLHRALKAAVADSFNMISVDGDTSTNDTVLVMAGGLAGNAEINDASGPGAVFQAALNAVCVRLAKSIVRDGEGATRLMEFTLRGAVNPDEARHGARVVVTSPLVKAAVHGSDPNWGRIVAALGRSGIALEETKLDVSIGDICMVKGGSRVAYDEAAASRLLSGDEVFFTVDLNLGEAEATAWGCDLSPEYANINSEYTT